MKKPIEQKFHALMNDVAHTLDAVFNGDNCPKEKKEVGFMLFVYDINKGPQAGQMNYISNSDRIDNYASMKEFAANFEARNMLQHPTKQ